MVHEEKYMFLGHILDTMFRINKPKKHVFVLPDLKGSLG